MPAYPGVYKRGPVWAYRTQWREGAERRSLSGSGYPTARDAARALAAAKRDAQSLRGPGQGARAAGVHRLPLGRYLEDVWLPSRDVKASTAAQYRNTVAYFRRNPVAAVPLDALTEDDVRRLVTTMQATLAHATAKNRLTVLRVALNHAVRIGALAKSPARYVTAKRTTPKPRRQFWDAEQARRFLGHAESAGDPLAPLFRLAVVTGMRRGELLGLRWDDVDSARGLVHVRWNRVVVPGAGVLETSAKTEASEGFVTVDPATLAALGPPRLGHVFVHPETGEPWHPQTMVNRFLVACLEAGVPAIKFHGLRHTAATLMAEAGVPMSQAKERLRHWSESMTEAYTSVTSASARHVADVMASVLNPDAAGPGGQSLRLVS